MNRSNEFYLNMIQAELDQAKDALADGYVGKARNLIEVVIADCGMWIVKLEGKKGLNDQRKFRALQSSEQI